MAYENQIHCTGCGAAIPDVPEGSPAEALLCNACYEAAESDASRAESLIIPSLDAQAQDSYQQDATSSGRLLPEDL